VRFKLALLHWLQAEGRNFDLRRRPRVAQPRKKPIPRADSDAGRSGRPRASALGKASFFYTIIYIALAVFSYGFIDPNFPYKAPRALHRLIYYQRPLTTIIYIIVVGGLFCLYGWVLKGVKRRKLNSKKIWKLVFLSVVVLFFAFPAFSYDIFNYIATAKVAFFYRENPYLVMPIEFVGEPMLEFMHAANKITLYGPFWILLTGLPHSLINNLFLNVFSFKALVVAFYLGLSYLIWRLSKKSAFSLAFFALNPLVVLETLVSSHNDVVMMFFALLGLYLLIQGKRPLSFLSLLASIGIKYATLALVPIFFLSSRLKKEQITILSFWALFLVFCLAPFREEIYPWYVIWLISFAALVPERRFIFWLTIALSLGTLGRYLPFLYTRSWEGMTPMVKWWVTVLPPVIVALAFFKANFSREVSKR